MDRHTARIALVTGANSGIGAAVVRGLQHEGYRVISSGRRLEAVRASVEGMDRERVIPLQLDIADPESVDSLLDRLPPEWREIEVLVNNAGHDRGGRRPFHEISPADLRSIIETNVIGLMHVTRCVIEGMVARNRGHVVNIGSVQGLLCYPRTSVYTASKFAIRGFTECLRLEHQSTGIRITEIQPGTVETRFAENRWNDADRAESFYGRFDALLGAEDVAAAVLYALAQPPHVDIAQVVMQPSGRTPG